MTTVVLEGDGLDELLARVADEHGEGARVVRAERVRVGGVGGFFARQRYEVVVELDDEPDAPASQPADGAAPAVQEAVRPAEESGEAPEVVVDERRPATAPQLTSADAGEHQHGPRGRDQEETHVLGLSKGTPAVAAEVPTPRATADPTAGTGRRDEVLGDIFDSPIARALVRGGVLDPDANAPVVGRAARGGALDRLVDAADAGDDAAVGINGTNGINGAAVHAAAGDGAGADGRGGSSPRARHAAPAEPLERGRPLSTESAAFAAVLDAVRGAAEPDVVGAPAPTAGATPRPGAEHEVQVAQGAEPVAAGAAVAELMALLAARHVAEGAVPLADAEPSAAEGAQDVPSEHADLRQQEDTQAQAAVRRRPEAAQVAAPAPAAPAPAPGGDDAGAPRARAAAAGLPAHLLERLPLDATTGELHELLQELPEAPPLPGREGDLVAVVGAPREALVVAMALATRLGIGPEGVVVAARPTGSGSPRREVVRDAVAARRAAATVRLGDAPGVVVVQVECDPESVHWARGVVGALRADQVHVVVDATRKSSDSERWLDGVFVEDPDAAHVVQAAGSADPGTVLGFELPVASVDGGDGGASAWTSLLTRALPEPVAAEPARRRRERRVAR